MFPATISVIPNSPSARQKASTPPASTERHASGRVTLQKTDHSERPRVRAACSSCRSTDSKPAWADLITRAIEPTHAASTAAPHVKANSTPIAASARPTGPRLPITTSR